MHANTPTLKVYSDYKSPYAFLAKDQIYELAADAGVHIEWLPYTLDIPAYLGSAKVDPRGKVLEESRNAHQWRRVKYSYMDCRREANLRGLTIRGPQKIFDSTLANAGLLYAREQGVLHAYHHIVFERFWKRELDIESPKVLAGVIGACGGEGKPFPAWLEREGRKRLAVVQREAEAAGVFGVPTFLLPDGDLYWGREHIPRIRELIELRRAAWLRRA
jgi:2-hydroxychromene-2-carboxylate isomerase